MMGSTSMFIPESLVPLAGGYPSEIRMSYSGYGLKVAMSIAKCGSAATRDPMKSSQVRRLQTRKVDKTRWVAERWQVQSQDHSGFQRIVQTLNELLSRESPDTFNSSWIQRRAPRCYRFIWKNVRTVFGAVAWDRVTCALERKFQRRWVPGRRRRSYVQYRNHAEVKLALKEHRAKLYVFLAPHDLADRRIRDIISVTLVRLAQYGNMSAKHEIMRLVGYTIDDWIDRHYFLSRWRGYDTEIRKHLERCIRRYRYTGSFLHYVFRTLECAGRGIKPHQAHSLDEPIFDGALSRIETLGQDPETNTLTIYRRHKGLQFRPE